MVTCHLPAVVRGRGNQKRGNIRQSFGRHYRRARHHQNADPSGAPARTRRIIELESSEEDAGHILANNLPVAKGTVVVNGNRIAGEVNGLMPRQQDMR